MMKKLKGFTAGVLLSVLTSGALSVARPPLFEYQSPSWQKGLAEELGLSVNQLRVLNQLREERRIALRKIIKNTPNPLEASMEEGHFNPSLYRKLRLLRARLISKIEANLLSKFYSILTPQQRAKLKELIAGRAGAFR
jgi:Spy/CpxP family protein refolding chaperone